MKHTYFVNDRIRLRAMEPEDLELICEMENDCEKADLLKAMLDEYEVSEEKASADIDTFIQKLREADVLE